MGPYCCGIPTFIAAVFLEIFLVFRLTHVIRQRELANARAVFSRDALRAGPCVVTGQAYAEQPAVAPLTGRPCIAWRLACERYQRVGKSTKSAWQSNDSKDHIVPFRLQFDDGEIHVDPAKCSYDRDKIRTLHSQEFNEIPDSKIEQIAADTRIHISAMVDDGEPQPPRRFQETIFAPGDILTVSGDVTRESDGRWTMSSPDGHMIISDKPLDAMRAEADATVKTVIAGLIAVPISALLIIIITLVF